MGYNIKNNAAYGAGVKAAKSPYIVTIAPGFTQDNSAERVAAFKFLQGKQQAEHNAFQKLIGNLDTTVGAFDQIFTNITTIRQQMTEALNLPFLDEFHSEILRTTIKELDEIAARITTKVIPMLDNLGN